MDCRRSVTELPVSLMMGAKEGAMSRINAGRAILGGLVAGLIFFIGDAIVNGSILKSEWSEVLKVVGIGADDAFHNPAYFATDDLLKGQIAVFLYASIRPRFGAGPRTAAIAGLTLWTLVLPVPMIGLLPMRFLPAAFVAMWSILALLPILIGTLVGGWLYREVA